MGHVPVDLRSRTGLRLASGDKVDAGNRMTTTTLVQRDMGYAMLHAASSRKYIKDRVIAHGVG
jgi:hypothetical protein